MRLRGTFYFISLFVLFVVTEASADSKANKCPLSGHCPYVDSKSASPHTAGCPAEKCPYYAKHANDHSEADTIEVKCPLTEKCPYYRALKNGEVVDMSGGSCPLAEKCPYYTKFKSGAGALDGCPLMKGGDASKCPHLSKKDGVASSSSVHPESCPMAKQAGGGGADIAKCPHMAAKQKADALKAAAVATETALDVDDVVVDHSEL